MPTLNFGHKTIDAQGIDLVREIRPEDLATTSKSQDWQTVIRKLDNSGGVSLKSTADIVADLARQGVQLSMLSTGEAVDARAIKSVAALQHKPGAPNLFNTTVHFENESNPRGTWLVASTAEVAKLFAASRTHPATPLRAQRPIAASGNLAALPAAPHD